MRLIDIEPLIDDCDEIIAIEWNHKVAPPSWAYAEEEFKQRLLDAPVIEAKPVKHGRWDKNHPEDNIVYCDQCYIPQDMPTPYCHNCGAKMDGRDAE